MAFGLSLSWRWEAGNERERFIGTILIIPFTIFLVLWYVRNIKKSEKANAQLPPGPRGLPVVGYLPFLGVHLPKKFTELAGVYGPIYKLWVGNKLYVVISSPSLAKQVVRDDDAVFANRDPPIAARISSYGGNDIAWSPNGSDWKKMRKVFVREMMSNTTLDTLYELRKQVMKKTVRNLHQENGKPIDVGELSFLTNINAIMSMMWGRTLAGEEESRAATEFRNLVTLFLTLLGKSNISDVLPVLARFDLQGIGRQAKEVFLGFDKFVSYIIERCLNNNHANKQGLEQNKQRKDFLQLLLELRERADPDTAITITQLKGMLLDTVVAGSETTSTMVEWTLAELMKHLDKMEKVHQELDEVVGRNNTVEELHLPRLQYLDAVVKEAFRLHPPVPFLLPRCPSRSCTVGGYTIPKGSTVFLNVYSIHRDPHLWENPLEFQPERFLKGETAQIDFSGNNFQFFPFGSGRRICAGLPMAQRMLSYQLASLLHSFEWKLSSDMEIEFSEKFVFVMKKMKPLVAIPSPRLSDPALYE